MTNKSKAKFSLAGQPGVNLSSVVFIRGSGCSRESAC
jgi:hypothetical protein